MSFWSNALGGAPEPAPQAPQQPAVAPGASQPWFIPRGQFEVAQQGHMPAPQIPQQPTANAMAKSSFLTTNCPNCGSGNYFEPPSGAAPHCYECGFTLSHVANSTAGMRGSGEGPVKAARQVAESGYHPQQVVGKVG